MTEVQPDDNNPEKPDAPESESSVAVKHDPTPVAAASGKVSEPARRAWWLRHYTFFGTAVGLVFIWLSMTPSLLPRGPLFQGVLSGAAGGIGYAIGVFAVWLVRYMRSKETSPRAPRWAWLGLIVVGILGQIAAIVYFHVWQDDVRDLMGVPRLRFWDHPLTAVLSLVFLFIFVEIGQLIRKLVRFLDRQLKRVAPPRVSAVVTVALLLVVTVAARSNVCGTPRATSTTAKTMDNGNKM